MNYYEIPQTVTMSLLTKLDDDPSTGKTVYEKTTTVRFKYTKEIFPENSREELFNKLLNQMYKDLLETDLEGKTNSLGMWVELEDQKFENAIDLQVLQDIKIYGEKDVDPIVELYKMTIEYASVDT